jgi:endonuclease/exonuclease/phosphatase family metal-dependent hydrolase
VSWRRSAVSSSSSSFVHGAERALAVAGLLVLGGIATVAARGPAAVPAADGEGGPCQRATSIEGDVEADVPVRWILPERPEDRETLARWCQSVGPALVRAVPDLAQPERIERFAVVSWNQHVGAGDLRRLVADLRRGALTGGVPVEQFVLLLQEVYRNGEAIPPSSGLDEVIPPGFREPPPEGNPREDVRALARSLGLALFYAPSMRNGRERPGEVPEDRGNAILSTFEFDSLRVVTLPFERQRRAGLVAEIRIPSGAGAMSPLRLASLHLDVWPALLPSMLDGRRRIRQSEAFAQALESNGTPLVVGADLNSLSAGDPQVRYFRARWPEIAPPSRCRTRWRFCTDYLFADGLSEWEFGTYQILADRYGSDHRPLVALATRRNGLPPAR